MSDDAGYRRTSLADLTANPDKPGRRWAVSSALDVDAYNYNVAELPARTRLSRTAYHAHPEQREFYHVLAGRCRVEVDDGAFVLGPDEFVVFDPGVPHLLHNPYDDPCRLVAVGDPPEAHHPVEALQSSDDLLAERYGGDPPTDE